MGGLYARAARWLDARCLVLMLGYGMARTLMNLTYANVAARSNDPFSAHESGLVFTLSACAGIMLCAAAVALFCIRHPHLHLYRGGIAALCLLVALNLLAGLPMLLGNNIWIITIPIALLYGLGAVISNAAWLTSFTDLGPRRCVVSLAGGFLFSSLACLAVGRLPLSVQCFVVAAVGIVCLVLFCLHHRAPHPASDQTPLPKSGTFKLLRELWSPLVIYVIATMAFGFATSFLSHNPLGETALARNLATIAGAAITVLLAVIANRMFDLRRTFLAAFPILALFLVLLPFLGPAFNEIFCILLVGLFEIVNAAMLFLLVETARLRHASVAAAVAAIMCIGRAGLLVSLVLGITLEAVVPLNGLVRGLILVLTLMYLLSMGFIALVRGRRNLKDGMSFELSDEAIVHAVEDQEDNLDKMAITGQIRSGQKDPAATLDERVHEIGHAHYLSPRETEVVRLLAHGRSVPYISQELGLSINTVRTYAQESYKKLDVHSKQELIDLFTQSALQEAQTIKK